MHGTTDEHLPEHSDEFMWSRERYGKTGKAAYESLITHIKEKYPLP